MVEGEKNERQEGKSSRTRRTNEIDAARYIEKQEIEKDKHIKRLEEIVIKKRGRKACEDAEV